MEIPRTEGVNIFKQVITFGNFSYWNFLVLIIRNYQYHKFLNLLYFTYIRKLLFAENLSTYFLDKIIFENLYLSLKYFV